MLLVFTEISEKLWPYLILWFHIIAIIKCFYVISCYLYNVVYVYYNVEYSLKSIFEEKKSYSTIIQSYKHTYIKNFIDKFEINMYKKKYSTEFKVLLFLDFTFFSICFYLISYLYLNLYLFFLSLTPSLTCSLVRLLIYLLTYFYMHSLYSHQIAELL